MSQPASQFSSAISNEQINVTPTAREKLVELLQDAADDGMEAVRVFVSGGGCGGMTYGMTFTDQRSDFDCVMEGDDQFKLYVDAVALNFLTGAEIDYVDRPMGGASFVFRNVFASVGGSGACGGCGAAGGAPGGGCA